MSLHPILRGPVPSAHSSLLVTGRVFPAGGGGSIHVLPAGARNPLWTRDRPQLQQGVRRGGGVSPARAGQLPASLSLCSLGSPTSQHGAQQPRCPLSALLLLRCGCVCVAGWAWPRRPGGRQGAGAQSAEPGEGADAVAWPVPSSGHQAGSRAAWCGGQAQGCPSNSVYIFPKHRKTGVPSVDSSHLQGWGRGDHLYGHWLPDLCLSPGPSVQMELPQLRDA